MNKVVFSSEKLDWGTPQDLFDELNEKHRFLLDAAATAENTKCMRFISPEQDALAIEWKANRVWLNPPYGRGIGRWTAKAREEALKGKLVVMLIPARTDTRWWQDTVTQPLGEGIHQANYFDTTTQSIEIYGKLGEVKIQFLRDRLKFEGAEQGAPFPSAIVTFDGRQA